MLGIWAKKEVLTEPRSCQTLELFKISGQAGAVRDCLVPHVGSLVFKERFKLSQTWCSGNRGFDPGKRSSIKIDDISKNSCLC